MEMWAIWFIVGAGLLIVEMVTLTFYCLWLAVGAGAAGIVAIFLPDSFVAQCLVGALVALLLTLFTKRLTRLIRKSAGYRDPIDDLVGKEGIVMEDVEEGKPGLVKVGSETWSAFAALPIRKGESVVVTARGTTMLTVGKKGDEET